MRVRAWLPGTRQLGMALSTLPQLKCLGLRKTGCAGEGAAMVLKALK